MFFTTLRTVSPYTDDAYDRIMSSVSGPSYREDRTMVSTLRALLFERLGGVEFKYNFFEMDSLSYENLSPNEIFTLLFPRQRSYSLSLCDLTSSSKEDFDIIVAKLGLEYNELSNIREYLRTKCDASCAFFVNPDANAAYILTQGLNMRIYHLLQAFLFRCFPKIFEEKPFTEDEKAFLKTLTENSSKEYVEKIKELSSQKNYRDQIIADQLSGFEKRCRDSFISTAKQKNERALAEMNEAMEHYRRMISRHEETVIRLEGLLALKKKASDDKDLVDYFIAHDMLDLEKVSGRKLCFSVRSFLNYFDVDGFERFSKNGDIYNDYSTRGGAFSKKEDRKLLMDAIFNEDPALRIKMCAYFELDIAGDVHTVRDHSFGEAYNDYLVNPHYSRHACLGGNAPAIIEFIKNGNIIGAVEQCIAATQRVNVFETSVTFRPMLNQLFLSEKKIIQRNDGLDMTPKEALAWLKE